VATLALIALLAFLHLSGQRRSAVSALGARRSSALTARREMAVGSGITGGQLIVEPVDGSRPLVRILDKAQRSIFAECYILSNVPVVHALERAAAQGVQVYVLLEPHPLGMGTQPQRLAAQLKAAGVKVRWTVPAFALTHAKVMVVDDRRVVISTANFSRAAFTKNREFLYVSRDSDLVRQVSGLFRDDWDRLPVNLTDRNLVVAPQDARQMLAALMQRARTSLRTYAEEVNDPTMERLLLSLAHRRVRVEVILAAGQTPQAAAVLERGGVQVRTMKAPYIHAKMSIADGKWAYLGSENISTQSLDRNREVGVVLRGSWVRHLMSIFDRDWGRAA
jgi:phosphatidylserine/phosphatidylglycerophosphate/cardiolipin synthase-like enzyme